MLPLLINLSAELFGIEIVDAPDFAELIMRFSFNLLVTLVIVRYIYYPRTHRRDFLFTYLLIGIVVFLMCFLLESVKLQLGFALGLFAVFGIIRYRTTQIPIKEMTYLFIVIGISVVNALANKKVSYAELLFTNIMIIAITHFVERFKSLENESFTVVHYEKIEQATPANKVELIEELEKRLGVKISRIELSTFDYQRDVVKIFVYFFKSHQTWADMEDLEYRTTSNE
ncbi:MAG: DUF4956 domain-containing protein [Salinivirgaceae bacterium]|jgi:hypothetical protein|nr:DUF4956 domain-containing protein [Salinivirgaceae bacterium]